MQRPLLFLSTFFLVPLADGGAEVLSPVVSEAASRRRGCGKY